MTACASSAIAVLRGLLKPPQWWEGRDLSFRQEKTGFSRLGRQGHPEINKGSIFAMCVCVFMCVCLCVCAHMYIRSIIYIYNYTVYAHISHTHVMIA